MKQYGSVHAKYASKMVDVQSDFQMDQNGEVWIEGDRYHLELGDYVIVCDGSTVWTYEPEMGECYIDDAETIAEDGVDPARMFTIWEEGFKKVWKGELEMDGRKLTQVDLYPMGAEDRSFHTIQCFIDAQAFAGGQPRRQGTRRHGCPLHRRGFRRRCNCARGRVLIRQGPLPWNDHDRQQALIQQTSIST